MRLPALAASLLPLFFIASCASSVSPLYTKADAVADPAIVGTWVSNDPNNSGTVRIEKATDGSYQVMLHDSKSGDDSVYDAHLIRLGGVSFADLLLTDDLPAGAVALHQILKYQVAGDDLSYSMIDPGALKKSAKQPGFPLQFRDTKESGGDTVIFSATDQLRRYFSAHLGDIFATPDHLKRQH